MFMFHSRDHEVAPQEIKMPEAAQRPVGLRIWGRWGRILTILPYRPGLGGIFGIWDGAFGVSKNGTQDTSRTRRT